MSNDSAARPPHRMLGILLIVSGICVLCCGSCVLTSPMLIFIMAGGGSTNPWEDLGPYPVILGGLTILVALAIIVTGIVLTFRRPHHGHFHQGHR